MDNLVINTQSKVKSHQIIAWSILLGLLFLRLPFLAGIAYFFKPYWLEPAFTVGTYLLTACLVWWERDRLPEFHIDKLALYTIILFKPVQTVLLSVLVDPTDPLAFPNFLSLVCWAIAIALLVALWINRPGLVKFSKVNFKWFGIGVGVGLLAALLLGFPMSLQVDRTQLSGPVKILSLLVDVLPLFFYQLGYAAVTEEPLFRGFLWGVLKNAGWKNVWIWLFQAALFMLAHIYYFNRYPISFWLIVPAGALLYGALVWRSKTLSSSLATHAMLNALGPTIAYIIASAA